MDSFPNLKSNRIERLDKELKDRMKPMEIIAAEALGYRLLAFLFLEMEFPGRSNPVVKVRANLLSLQTFPSHFLTVPS
jgi:hypothetical protein